MTLDGGAQHVEALARTIVCGLILLAAPWLGSASASSRPEAGSVTLEPSNALSALLAAFEASYQPPEHESAAWRVARATLERSENGLSPRLALAQELEWDEFDALSLALGLDLEVPLLSPKARAEQELAEVDLAVQLQAGRASRAQAKASFIVDLAGLATIDWAEQLVSAARLRIDGLGWGGSLPHTGYVPPAERELLKAAQRLHDTAQWLAQESRTLRLRLTRSIGRPADELVRPQLSDIELFLHTLSGELADQLAAPTTASRGPVRGEPPTASDSGACYASSPLVAAARLRHAQNLANDTARATPDYEVGLRAHLGYAVTPWSGASRVGVGLGAGDGGELNGAVRIEGRYPLPDSWPLAGSVSLEAGLGGLEQRLELSWPPLQRPGDDPVDRERQLANELEDVASRLLAARRAWLAAKQDKQRLARDLSWLLGDASPGIAEAALQRQLEAALTSPALGAVKGARSAGAGGDVPADERLLLESVELRLQYAFARLAELTALTDYLVACGQL